MDPNDLAASLLRRTACLRGLARGLVADENAVDDLVQEAWLASARRPPRDERAAGSWLRRVLGNFARMRHREESSRRRLERAVARPEKLSTSPHEVLERAELQQRLVERVLELPEPYRSTVLLRFFEEMTAREIALHQEVPVTTVRSRLGAALEKLRARLDREHGGDRGAWRLVLLPLTGWTALELTRGGVAAAASGSGGTGAATAAGWLATGGTIMGMKGLVLGGTAGAILLAAGLAVGTRLGRDGARERELEALRRDREVALGRIAKLQQEAKARDALLGELRSMSRIVARGEPAADRADAAAAPGADAAPRVTAHDLLEHPDQVERYALTADQIEATLERHGRSPDFLVAAARLTSDLDLARAYLEEALAKDPGSPSALLGLLDVQIRAGDADADVIATLEALEVADPTNALPHVHLAHRRAKAGDFDGALAEMLEGALKPRVNDYGPKSLPRLHDFYREAGHSPGVAKILAVVGMRVENLVMQRELSKAMSRRAGELFEAGDPGAALTLLQGARGLAQKLMTSGRTVLEEVMGMVMHREAMEREKEIRQSQGEAVRAGELERQLALEDARKARYLRIMESYQPALQQLSDDEISAFFDRVYAEGEAAAALDLPGVREAADGATE